MEAAYDSHLCIGPILEELQPMPGQIMIQHRISATGSGNIPTFTAINAGTSLEIIAQSSLPPHFSNGGYYVTVRQRHLL